MARLALLATAGLATAFVSKSGPAPAVVRAPAQTAMQMKLYDWKRREAAEDASVGATEFRVDNIKPAPGATKRKMRKGRGISAGQGATCGFGMRGQKSRSGRPMRAGFEGGQTPLPAAAEARGPPDGPGPPEQVFSLIKLEQLAGSSPNSEVDFASLLAAGQVTKKKYDVVKVVGSAAIVRAGRPHGQGARLHGPRRARPSRAPAAVRPSRPRRRRSPWRGARRGMASYGAVAHRLARKTHCR